MYLYSVIIPHKDSLDLLQRCVASVPVRDNLQIIVVDDKSDISQDEWDSFKKDNSRVELYLTKEGQGAGYARNVGLSHAKGEWILFADADDYFSDGAFQMLDRYSESSCDALYFQSFWRKGDNLEIVNNQNPAYDNAIMNGDYDKLRYNSFVPWGKMIKRDIIEKNNIKFEEIEVSNDIMFSARQGLASKTIEVLPQRLYNYTINENSLYHIKNVHREITRIRATKQVNDFLHDNGLDDYRLSYRHSLKYCLFFLPKHPFLFLWGIWTSRYKGATLEYIGDLVALSANCIIARLKRKR